MYGQKWTSQITDDQMLDDLQKVWGYHLAKFSPDEIKRSLDALPKSYPEWPPTVGQFMELCDVGRDTLPEFKALPRPWGSSDAAEPAFEELRKILGYKAN